MELMLAKKKVLEKLRNLLAEGEKLSDNKELFHWAERSKTQLIDYFVDDGVADRFWEQSEAKYKFYLAVGDKVADDYFCTKSKAIKFLKILIRDLENETMVKKPTKIIPFTENNRVFIVHGHNEAVQQKVARTLEKVGLEPVILSDEPNSGCTIIEKFEKESDVGFAVVLMTADDQGGSNSDVLAEELTSRARQNVLLELGYFFGKLGREQVCVLKEQSVEFPTDILGIAYHAIDANESWKLKLIKELKAAGYNVDANKIM